MRNKKLHTTVIVIFLAIIAVCLYYICIKDTIDSSIKLGLDLKGGTQIILKPVNVGEEKITPESLDKAMLIIMDRIDKLGISEPLITRDYSDNIIIQLPGVDDPNRALEVIGKTAQLEFRVLSGYFVSQEGIVPINSDSGQLHIDAEEKEIFLTDPRTGGASGKLTADPETGELLLAGIVDGEEKILGKLINNPETGELLLAETETGEIIGEILTNSRTGGASLVGSVLMTGDKLSKANAGYDGSGRIIVSMSFTSEGQKIFEEVTSENIGKQLAIVLDDEIKSAPVIRTAISGDAVIEGIDSLNEAKDIALVLQTGALPVSLKVEESSTVGATLGKDALTRGLYAGIIGFVLIMLFMLAYYRGLGFVSVIGLIIYILIFWGIISGIGAALTLPGIAGIILTIGMAVDANVIIYERIKEEVKKGKSVRISISEGFKNGIRTIIDANVTTLITSAALYRFGTGPIRGFAVTLGLGIIISMMTSLILIRSILFLIAGNAKLVTPGFLGVRRKGSSI